MKLVAIYCVHIVCQRFIQSKAMNAERGVRGFKANAVDEVEAERDCATPTRRRSRGWGREGGLGKGGLGGERRTTSWSRAGRRSVCWAAQRSGGGGLC